MLINVLNGLAIFFYWTWFVWPFVFVFSLVYAIASFVKDERASTIPVFIAGLSLLIMLSPIVSILG